MLANVRQFTDFIACEMLHFSMSQYVKLSKKKKRRRRVNTPEGEMFVVSCLWCCGTLCQVYGVFKTKDKKTLGKWRVIECAFILKIMPLVFFWNFDCRKTFKHVLNSELEILLLPCSCPLYSDILVVSWGPDEARRSFISRLQQWYHILLCCRNKNFHYLN